MMLRATVGIAAVVIAAAIATGDSMGVRRCFGAAARDPAHPCHNPALRLAVIPSPRDAEIQPGFPCTPVERDPEVCVFGAARPVAAFALVGDSHAAHWRAALEAVVEAKGWRGLDIDRSRCPFMDAIKRTSRADRTSCARWNRRVRAWFFGHPAVHTVFVSQRWGVHVRPRRGLDEVQTRVAGDIGAWRSLPRSVRHVVVLRDVPYNRPFTNDCVARAIRRRTPAGPGCAIPRDVALGVDPAVVAAARLRSRRVQAIDLTRFMCDRALCYPVIGGALVHKDRGHLTRTFSATLGPFVLRKLNRLMRSWR